MIIGMTVKMTIWINVAECVTGMIIMMLICYRSVVLFIKFDVIVLALMIRCCSRARRRLSRRLRMVSSGTTVSNVSK